MSSKHQALCYIHYAMYWMVQIPDIIYYILCIYSGNLYLLKQSGGALHVESDWQTGVLPISPYPFGTLYWTTSPMSANADLVG